MKGTQFFWGILCTGVIGFTSCGTMQQRERGEHREFKCGTTTASGTSNRKLNIQNVTTDTRLHETNNNVQIESSKVSVAHTDNHIDVSNEIISNVESDSKNPNSNKSLTIQHKNEVGSNQLVKTKPRTIVTILPTKTEQKAIKEFVKSQFIRNSKNEQNRGIDAGDFLPVEGIISILAGLLGLVSGLQILRLIFGITAIVFGMWGWYKRFNILSKVGFWMGAVVLAWWALRFISAGIF